MKFNGILNTDLKPENTLFDVASRKMAIIDLGSSIFIEKRAEVCFEKFDIRYYPFAYGVSEFYCPPEMIASDDEEVEMKRETVNLKKSY